MNIEKLEEKYEQLVKAIEEFETEVRKIHPSFEFHVATMLKDVHSIYRSASAAIEIREKNLRLF